MGDAWHGGRAAPPRGTDEEELAALLADYGARWSIAYTDWGTWEATPRPIASAVVTADSPDELRSKIQGEELGFLRQLFPGWEFFVGVDRLPYGRRLNTSPPVTLRGEDPVDLRDEILRYMRLTR